VSKNGLIEPFISKNDHFTETGSGQTQGNSKTGPVFLRLKQLPAPKHEDWEPPAPSIEGVDLHIAQGELVLVSGPVAGGKSTLLQSLVGNTERLGGELVVPQSLAFQPQVKKRSFLAIYI